MSLAYGDPHVMAIMYCVPGIRRPMSASERPFRVRPIADSFRFLQREPMKLVPLALAAIISGCAGAIGTATNLPSAAQAWLVGYWVSAGENCESDAGVRFSADATWSAYESEGTWKLDGNLLFSLTMKRWGDPGEPETTLVPPERNQERIERSGANSYRSHRGTSEVVEMKRCPDERE